MQIFIFKTNMFTIDKIEGNSGIGVPVFSKFAQMQNYNFLVLSPVKNVKSTQEVGTDFKLLQEQ